MHGDDCSYIRTYTGSRFYPLDPRPEDVNIRDIAHHLSMLCRFTGAVKSFYSVGEHSVRVSFIVPTLQALVHDATEAYLNDIARPLKYSDEYVGVRNAEDRVWRVCAAAFKVPVVMDPAVHYADGCLLVTEKRDLLLPALYGDGSWKHKWQLGDVEPLPQKIYPVSPQVAEQWFLDRFVALGGKL